METRIAYLFLNGQLEGEKEFYIKFLREKNGDIYCADGGYRHCLELDIKPFEIWGDMDSIEYCQLEEAEELGIKLKKFPKDKDFTDGELLLQYLAERDYEKIYIIGGLGGDRAHELTNINLITKFRNIIFVTERENLFLLKNRETLHLEKGREVSFVPMSDRVEKLTLEGFRYPLKNYNLMRWESRCMSNITAQETATVTFDSGLLLGIIKNSKNN